MRCISPVHQASCSYHCDQTKSEVAKPLLAELEPNPNCNNDRTEQNPNLHCWVRFPSLVDCQMFCHGPPQLQRTADYGGMRRRLSRVQTGSSAEAIGENLIPDIALRRLTVHFWWLLSMSRCRCSISRSVVVLELIVPCCTYQTWTQSKLSWTDTVSVCICWHSLTRNWKYISKFILCQYSYK